MSLSFKRMVNDRTVTNLVETEMFQIVSYALGKGSRNSLRDLCVLALNYCYLHSM